MIPKSMPSGDDPMGGDRFSEEIMPKQKTGLIQRSWIRPSRGPAWRHGVRGDILPGKCREHPMERPMRVFSAVFVIALLTAPAYAQMSGGGGGGSGGPSLNLIPDTPTKTQDEIDAEEVRDKAYKESLRKIPDAKVSSDPWGTVRTDPPKTAKAATAKPRTKTGSTAN
jgi:hypothetical protein